MSGVAIQASFGKDRKPYNGLETIVEELLDKPLEERYIIAKVVNARTQIDNKNGGAETPMVSLEHIEVMLSDQEVKAAKKLFEQACKARLGELPQQTLFEDAKGDGTGEDEQS